MTVKIRYAGERLSVTGNYTGSSFHYEPWGSTVARCDEPAEFEIEEIRDGANKALDWQSWPDDEVDLVEQLCIEQVQEDSGPDDDPREDR
jgi:hypothetical protein